MKRHTTPAVDAITNMTHSGNIVNPLWVKWIKDHVPGSSSAASTAVLVLSDIVYWYRASVIRDETTGKVIEVRKRFKADKLQRSYDAIADQWAITKRQAQRAVYLLRDAGLITIELRTVIDRGVKIPNVVFLEPIPEAILMASQGGEPASTQKEQEVSPFLEGGHTKKGDTSNQKEGDKYIEYSETSQKNSTTTKQATPSGGGGSSTDSEVSFEEWSNAQKIAALIAEGGYIGEDGDLHSYRVTKQLIKACIGHNQKSAEQALMSTWEFMANQRTQGMRIRSPQGVLIKALRDWQQPTEEFEALHMSSIKIEQQTREWAGLAQRCGMLSHTAFAWGHWECVVKSSGKAYTLPYDALPPGMEHVTVADMKGYLEGLIEQSA